MAVRRWSVHPDLELHTQTQGVLPMVSREKLIEAAIDGVTMLDVTGGVLTIVVGRHPTDLPGEAITTQAVCEWKDGPRAKPQDEAAVSVLPDAAPAPTPAEPSPAPEASTPPAEPPVDAAGLQEAAAAHADDIGDGLDATTLAEEDVSSLEGAVN